MKTLFTAGLLASSLLATSATTKTDKSIEVQPTKKMDDVIVTANRVETEVSKIATSITVITAEDIAKKQPSSVAELLRTVPGVNVKNDGNHSVTSGVYIRGMRKYHTKVLINGVALQDTASPQIMSIINSIPLNDIERIEITRGAASTLYGSNAMGGVINIITKTPSDKTISGDLGLELGSHGWERYSGLINGKKGKLDYVLSTEWNSENGISSLQATDGNDRYRSLSLNGTIGWQFTDDVRLSAFGRYSDTNQEYDTNDFFLGIIESGELHHEQFQLGTKFDANNLFDDLVDSSLRLSYTESKRNELEAPMAFKGKTVELDWQNTIRINEFNRLIAGYTHTDERAKSDSYGTKSNNRYRTNAVYAQYEIEPLESLFLTAGLRYNNHSVFGGETTYSATAAYIIDSTGTKLKSTWGTGYRAPSLYELYAPFFGDETLDPETSESWDIGFEQKVTEKLEFGSSYFENRVTNYIGWNSGGWFYEQTTGIKIHGVESYISYTPSDKVNLTLTHTWQHSNDMDQDISPIVYLPENKITADLNWNATDKLHININGVFVDERTTDYVGGKTLSSYTLLNAAITYQLTDALELTGRVNNILDTDYAESLGYCTYGITGYAGLKYRF